MTAIDFSAFVDELASVSGETILPFFRTALSVEDKGHPGSFDPVTAADHAAETVDAHADPPHLPGSRHHRRGIRQGARRRRICLGARPDRRHQVLHFGDAGLGHADRLAAVRRAGVRHDEPALHPRALQRRRPQGALSRSGRSARSAGARLRRSVRGGPVHDQSAADECRRPRDLRPGREGSCGCRAMAATATPIAWWRPATSIS